MKPRTLVSFAWLAVAGLVIAHPFAGQSTNPDFIHLTSTIHAWWCHWSCPLASAGLIAWFLLGDKLGGRHGGHGGKGGGGGGEH